TRAAHSVYSPPPFTAELGFTRVRPPINWPKSDISDFGWRDREGACKKIGPCARTPSPPLPRKREREQTESAALSVEYSLRGNERGSRQPCRSHNLLIPRAHLLTSRRHRTKPGQDRTGKRTWRANARTW